MGQLNLLWRPLAPLAFASTLHTSPALASGEAPSWNFHKDPVDRSGTRVQNLWTRTAPGRAHLVGAVKRLLAEQRSSSTLNRPPILRDIHPQETA